MAGTIEVLAPGLLTTVQDVRGRPGLGRYGVAVGGALDPWSAATANLLVGNTPDQPVLEMTLVGPTLRLTVDTAVGLCGADLGATLDGYPAEPGWSRFARPGATLPFGERRRGARAYLAVAGGLDLPLVLGSPAADLRAGFSHLAGRALRAGDTVPIAQVPDVISRCGRYTSAATRDDPRQAVRVVPGPHVDRFAPGAFEQFCRATWHIADQADRMGYRLRGPLLAHTAAAEVASLGLPVGAVQVPGDGQPILLLADHQPTGGYPVLACVIRADLGVLAQRAPGDEVRFTPVSLAEARLALRARCQQMDAIETDDATWASLRLAESGSLLLAT